MGQFLSEPNTGKETSTCENEMFKVGASCMQGWRVSMEDAHTCFLHLPGDPTVAYFAVFDGHGGAKAAHFACNNLHKKIVLHPEYVRGNIAEGIRLGFLSLDRELSHDRSVRSEESGTTACLCFLRGTKIYCANVGDSRAVACVNGRAQPLSSDHKPMLTGERERIQAAGGFVEANRVNGNLALSRALGDFCFKNNSKKSQEEQIITANPDVLVTDLTKDIEFIVLACDGIWDVLTSQETVDFIRSKISKGLEPHQVCEELMMRCLATDAGGTGIGCDNMTVVLVCFLHGLPYTTLQHRCAGKAGSAAKSMKAMT